MIPADDALQGLRQGNETFWSGKVFHIETEILLKLNSQKWQNPFAIILGCSDSWVPAEVVFGQGIGDLFTIRVAGSIVANCEHRICRGNFGTRLIVVLGHSRCGAVQATLEQLDRPVANRSPHLYLNSRLNSLCRWKPAAIRKRWRLNESRGTIQYWGIR